MNAKTQAKLTTLLVASFLVMAVGLINMSKREAGTVTTQLTLPAPAERTAAQPSKLPGNVVEPEFVWVAPVAEPAGL